MTVNEADRAFNDRAVAALSEFLHRWADGDFEDSMQALDEFDAALTTADDPAMHVWILTALFSGTVGAMRLLSAVGAAGGPEEVCRAAAAALGVPAEQAFPPPVDPRRWLVRAAAAAGGAHVETVQALACMLTTAPPDLPADVLLEQIRDGDDHRTGVALVAAWHLLLGLTQYTCDQVGGHRRHDAIDVIVQGARPPAGLHVAQDRWDQIVTRLWQDDPPAPFLDDRDHGLG